MTQVICVPTQGEAARLNGSAPCGVSYEVCSSAASLDGGYAPPSLIGDSAAMGGPDAGDAQGDFASDAPTD